MTNNTKLKEEWIEFCKVFDLLPGDIEEMWKWIVDRFPDTSKRIICDICGCQISPYEHLCIGTKSTLNDYFRQYGRTVHKGGD